MKIIIHRGAKQIGGVVGEIRTAAKLFSNKFLHLEFQGKTAGNTRGRRMVK